MSDEILTGIAADLEEATTAIATAEELVSALKEAGEDVSEQEGRIRALKMRKTKWDKMMQSRGITPT